MVDEKADAKEDTRFKYRYIDLRTARMQRNIALRHTAAFAAREYLVARGFFEIDTPMFIKSTPEGARDYLVPSRLNPGRFYALPQSPQLYKQILMVSGFDRYFQIARCFRDEDARGDRQPEFTQIDIEMSFVSREDVFELVEGLMAHIFKKSITTDITVPFQRLAYDDAMNRYGSDKPDLRFGLELKDFVAFAKKGSFEVFKKVVESGGAVKALVAPGLRRLLAQADRGTGRGGQGVRCRGARLHEGHGAGPRGRGLQVLCGSGGSHPRKPGGKAR